MYKVSDLLRDVIKGDISFDCTLKVRAYVKVNLKVYDLDLEDNLSFEFDVGHIGFCYEEQAMILSSVSQSENKDKPFDYRNILNKHKCQDVEFTNENLIRDIFDKEIPLDLKVGCFFKVYGKHRLFLIDSVCHPDEEGFIVLCAQGEDLILDLPDGVELNERT